MSRRTTRLPVNARRVSKRAISKKPRPWDLISEYVEDFYFGELDEINPDAPKIGDEVWVRITKHIKLPPEARGHVESAIWSYQEHRRYVQPARYQFANISKTRKEMKKLRTLSLSLLKRFERLIQNSVIGLKDVDQDRQANNLKSFISWLDAYEQMIGRGSAFNDEYDALVVTMLAILRKFDPTHKLSRSKKIKNCIMEVFKVADPRFGTTRKYRKSIKTSDKTINERLTGSGTIDSIMRKAIGYARQYYSANKNANLSKRRKRWYKIIDGVLMTRRA